MSDIVISVRISIANLGGSELEAIETNPSIQDLFRQKQALIEEMNQAKKVAAELAAEPYLDKIAEIDRMYGMMLSMVGDNQG